MDIEKIANDVKILFREKIVDKAKVYIRNQRYGEQSCVWVYPEWLITSQEKADSDFRIPEYK
jgi:hypothetical protein